MFRVQEFYYSGTDAAAAAAAGAAATAAASAAAFVFTTVFTVVATVAAAEAAAAAVAAAPAAVSVNEEKDCWTLNILNVLDFGKIVLRVGVVHRLRITHVVIHASLFFIGGDQLCGRTKYSRTAV